MADLDLAYSFNMFGDKTWTPKGSMAYGGKCGECCNHKYCRDNSSMFDILRNLASNHTTQAMVKSHGLNIVNVAWEDTGRTKGSCFGPNISDMTLCVNSTPMPIIRYPNFADLTSDQEIGQFTVNVGNEKGSALRSISLKEYLENIEKYTDVKVTGSLIAERDTHVLTSSQACLLPLDSGKVEFAVNLYNYQSYSAPAVLVIVATAQGTSAHFVLGRNNVLRFNKNGEMADFVAERLKEDRVRRGVSTSGPMTQEEKERNAVLIYQIPIEYKAPERRVYSLMNSYADCEDMDGGIEDIVEKSATLGGPAYTKATSGFTLQSAMSAAFSVPRSSTVRGMDHAVVSTTSGRGKYPTLSGYKIKRDTTMPIRCTIQYYHVTDKVIEDEETVQIAEELKRHKPFGSLVTETSRRPTEHTAANPAPGFFSRMFGML